MDVLFYLTPYSHSVTALPEDPRLGQLIAGTDALADADVVIFGVPTDEGIRRNGGRIGASLAPDKIRSYLAKLTPFASPQHKKQLENISIVDLGNVAGKTLEEMHDVAMGLTELLIEEKKFVIALGGGHDITYPLVKGYATARPSPALINIDAHLDVRPLKDGHHHSGSSFRLLIEESHIDGLDFTEFGIQPNVIAREHYEWLMSKRSMVRFFDELSDPIQDFNQWLNTQAENCYVTFDVDAIKSSDAPGVSAPAAIGFSSEQAMAMCFAAGNSSKVGMMDFVEVSPPHDPDDRTSRLVARMTVNAMLGFANRVA